MQSEVRFSVYEHTLIIKNNLLVTRKFIVLRDIDKHIVAWTNFHKYLHSGKYRLARNISDDGNKRAYMICKLLNYVFIDKYQIKRLTDITIKMVSDYLNDYGLGMLPNDPRERVESTVNVCIRYVIDFLESVISDNSGKCKLKIGELYKEVSVYNPRRMKSEIKRVPAFKVLYSSSPREIFRDIPESVFSILMRVIADKHKDILMLAALGAFAGMRPSECCNVRRNDSPLGSGIRFVISNGEIVDIIIDLTKEINLRSDLIRVGRIKKERTQRVYPAFINAFSDCYQIYMEHMSNRTYEPDYGALTVNKQGKALTYKNYYMKFSAAIRDLIPELMSSNDPEAVNYGHLLLEKKIGPHIFRHWFSVKLTIWGEDISGLMYWRGDKSPLSALTYLQNKGDLEKQLEKVNNEIFDYSLWKAGKQFTK